MKSFRVTHVVLCEVQTYRIIQAESYDKALEKIAAIDTVTGSNDCDYEICADIAVKQLTVTELEVSK